jgi:hypothetical protein
VAKSKTIRSTRELAAAVGRSQPAVLKWLKHEAWTFGRGPWNAAQVEQIKAWATANLSPNPAPGSRQSSQQGEESAGTALKRVKAAREGLKLAAERGDLHRVDECEMRRSRLLRALNARLFGELDGLPISPESIDIVRKWMTEIFTEFAQGYVGTDKDRLAS